MVLQTLTMQMQNQDHVLHLLVLHLKVQNLVVVNLAQNQKLQQVVIVNLLPHQNLVHLLAHLVQLEQDTLVVVHVTTQTTIALTMKNIRKNI